MLNAKEANTATINSIDKSKLEIEIEKQIKKAVDKGKFTTFVKVRIDPDRLGFLATKRVVENILTENGYKINKDHSCYYHTKKGIKKELINIQVSW